MMPIDSKIWKTLTRQEKIPYLAANMSVEDMNKRLSALMNYQMSMYRINEQSEAADREHDRVLNTITLIQAALKTAREKEKQNE